MRTFFTLIALALLAAAAACSGDTESDPAATGGVAGASSGGKSGAGGNSGSGGSGGTGTCFDLESDYQAKLAQAKQCSLFPGGPGCTTLVGGGLGCPGCGTFVDTTNAELISELQSLEQQWDALGCTEITKPGCDAGICFAPVSANCQAGGQGGDVGVCVDVPGTPPWG